MYLQLRGRTKIRRPQARRVVQRLRRSVVLVLRCPDIASDAVKPNDEEADVALSFGVSRTALSCYSGRSLRIVPELISSCSSVLLNILVLAIFLKLQ
jgi:hypothetical protein